MTKTLQNRISLPTVSTLLSPIVVVVKSSHSWLASIVVHSSQMVLMVQKTNVHFFCPDNVGLFTFLLLENPDDNLAK